MSEKLLSWMESVTAPFWQWCAGFIGVLFIRFYLETLSGPTQSFPAVPDTATLVHYFLFFAGAFFSLAIILGAITGNFDRSAKFLAFGLPIIWLSPIVDLLFTHGTGHFMSYLFAGNFNDILRAFFHGGSLGVLQGLTPGLRIELAAIIIGGMGYVAAKTQSSVRVIATGVIMYLVLFLWLVSPGLVVTATHGHMSSSVAAPSLVAFFAGSHLLTSFLRPTESFSYIHAAETVLNLGMSILFYILDFVLILIWASLRDPRTTGVIADNLRLGRVAFYLGMVVLGFLGAVRAGAVPFLNWIDIAAFAVIIVTYFCAFLFAIGVNDIYDVDIDRISAAHRPLPSGNMTEENFRNTNVFFLAWTVVGGFLSGYWVFFLAILFTAAYYIYSAAPLRLKRIPILSSFLIALAALSALMSGFFFADAQKLAADFPMRIIVLVLVCMTLAVNFKDIKDIEGDRADGIWTLFVIFGEERGKMIAGALLAAAFLAVPAILRSGMLFIPSLIAAIAGYGLVTAKKYREGRIFILYFIYLAIVGGLLWKYPPIF